MRSLLIELNVGVQKFVSKKEKRHLIDCALAFALVFFGTMAELQALSIGMSRALAGIAVTVGQ